MPGYHAKVSYVPTNHESREETEMSTNHKTDAERLAAAPRWFPDNTGTVRYWDGQKWTDRTPPAKTPEYVVLQVVLKEELEPITDPEEIYSGIYARVSMTRTGSGNLSLLEDVINRQAAQGFRLHTITTAASGSSGRLSGDLIRATLAFERLG